MEVNADSFPHHLLELLIAISEADFVSFDLELSGIPSRMPAKPVLGKPRDHERASLEYRYAEAKAGAERYQILQVGITCARFDYLTNKYILRPYNINISPLLDEQRLDVEREFSFQSGAVAFLLSHGFSMELPFTKGVQYLSRDEAARAKRSAYDRFDKKHVIEDLQLKETDVDSLDFVRRVREALANWKASSDGGLKITTHTGLEEQPAVPVISRFEKRLVHQLVRAEFPDLVAIGRTDCIKIIRFDAEREAANSRTLKNRVKEQITRQIGFRWVVEALAGGNFSSIDPIYFARNSEGMVIAADLDNINLRFMRAAERLKVKQPVLVGHNMFTDLVYFYHTFIGKLPDTLKEFRAATHGLFPRIVDTKYLATHDGGDLRASPTLQEIAESLENQPLPEIVTHASHSKYHDSQAFHEAGYDSLLTATILLRLSTSLGNSKPVIRTMACSNSEASPKIAKENQRTSLLDGQDEIQEPVSLPPVVTPAAGNVSPTSKARVVASKSKKKSKKSTKSSQKDGRFATRNLFEDLRDIQSSLNEPGEDVRELKGGVYEDRSNFEDETSDVDMAWKDEPFALEESEQYAINMIQRDPMELIPSFDSPFWRTFGNKLRTFGAQETVLTIAEWE